MAEQPQTGHPQFSEDLALYALGALDSSASLEKHLQYCNSCRRELAELRGDAALLALSAAASAAPQRSRARLLAAIAQEKQLRQPQPAELRALPIPVLMSRSWRALAPVFTSLVLAIFAILLWRDNMNLKQANEELSARVVQANQQSADTRQVLDLLNARDAAQFSLVSTAAKPTPHVKTIYQQRTGQILLMASNLAPIPSNKSYELWLIPPQGAPIPAGLFKPSANGSAVMLPSAKQLPAGIEAKAFAVTVEDQAGAATPTPPIVLKGAGE